VAPSGNQTATEKTNINLKRSEKPVYSPPAGQVGTDVPVKRIFFFPLFIHLAQAVIFR
jgi:hypothetical protein